jgi:tripartite-type tricarboxylate transporter receptor subunit TctC
MLLACFSLSTLMAVGVVAQAQNYPNKPIRLIVPWPPGGGVDTSARIISQPLSERLGQPIVIENKPGASGNIGTALAAQEKPDGYTLLMGSVSPNAVNPHLFTRLGFDPVNDFSFIGHVYSVPSFLVVPAASPFKTAQELVAYAKANPGKLNHGASLGVPPHMLGEFIRAKTGIEMPYVPYRSTAAAIPDFLSGQIQATSESLSVMLPHIQSGAARPLAVAGKRLPELPDLPTLDEAGLTGYPPEVWMGIVAPGGTPAAVVEKLNAAINQGLKSPETQASFTKIGFQTRPGSVQDFVARIKGDVDGWDSVIKLTGVKVD